MKTKIVNLGKDKFIKFDNFLSYFSDEADVLTAIKEIFEEKIYEFRTLVPFPLVIDIGSGLGIAALYIKKQYPTAKIVCFEPNSILFRLNEKNLRANEVQGVTLVNVDPAQDVAKLISYVNHPIDFLKLDLPHDEIKILTGLGKKILNIKELVCKCDNKKDVEDIKQFLSANFKISIHPMDDMHHFILRAKKR